jgi:hypothetical protein
MGKHRGGSAGEPTTNQGKSFDQMSGEEKAKEFDASHADPRGYAAQNFTDQNQSSRGGKHRK